MRKESTVASVVNRDLVGVISEEMAIGVERAVDCWMTQIELALTDIRLTAVDRLNAVQEIVESYKHLTGKDLMQNVQFDCRRA
jgi:hypothetical protein